MTNVQKIHKNIFSDLMWATDDHIHTELRISIIIRMGPRPDTLSDAVKEWYVEQTLTG